MCSMLILLGEMIPCWLIYFHWVETTIKHTLLYSYGQKIGLQKNWASYPTGYQSVFKTPTRKILQFLSLLLVATVPAGVLSSAIPLGTFSTAMETLSTTLKDLAADQRSQNNQTGHIQKKVISELSGIKDLVSHVRSNTLNTAKEVKNGNWQLSELRSGAVDKNGVVTAQCGSLLFLISEDLKTSAQATMDALRSSVQELQDAVEKGVNPEKSYMRKNQELQEHLSRLLDQYRGLTWFDFVLAVSLFFSVS